MGREARKKEILEWEKGKKKNEKQMKNDDAVNVRRRRSRRGATVARSFLVTSTHLRNPVKPSKTQYKVVKPEKKPVIPCKTPHSSM